MTTVGVSINFHYISSKLGNSLFVTFHRNYEEIFKLTEELLKYVPIVS